MSANPEAVMDALIAGVTIAEAQRRFGLTELEVKSILDDETKRYYDATAIRERWMMAERRLLNVELLFYEEAVTARDKAAAMVFVKANERRATLTGANAPIGHVVQLTNAAPLIQETSTEYYARVLDQLIGKPEPPADESPDKPN